MTQKSNTESEFATLLGISPRQMLRLAKAGMPTDDLERAQEWRERHIAGRVATTGGDLVAARTQLALEQAARVRQKRLAADERLMPTEDAHRILAGMRTSLTVRLRAAERRFRAAHPSLPAGVYAMLRQEFDAVIALAAPRALSKGADAD